MKIIVETIPHDEQRYDTLGDYWDVGGTKHIRVSDLGDDKMNLLIAVHELVETYLCDAAGISEEIVKAFDEAHPDDPDPGSHPGSPYRAQHERAEGIEHLMAIYLGVDWADYEARCREVAQTYCG